MQTRALAQEWDKVRRTWRREGPLSSLLGLGAPAQTRPRGLGTRLGASPWVTWSPDVLSVDT